MKYSVSPMEIQRAKPKGFPEGSGYISLYFLTQYIHSQLQILKELNLCICLTSRQYEKTFPSRGSNTGEVNVNIRMFSNLE